jgi:Ca-activated chloride channel family protein
VNLDELSFEYPYVFGVILLFVVCAIFCAYKPGRLYFAHLNMVNESSMIKNHVASFFKWIAILALASALASPVIVNKEVIKESIGYDIVVAMDASGSMRYPFRDDRRYSKFDITKALTEAFITKREKDNVSAVAFGKYAFILSPLTYDKTALASMVSDVVMREGFSDGTAIGDSIMQSVQVLKGGEAKEKMIVLLTDGDEKQAEGLIAYDKATAIAKKYGIKIYTIGIGQNGEYNYALLNYIAQETGGKLFEARNAEALADVFQSIDTLEKSKIKSHDFVKKDYYYHYPLFVAIMALLGFIFFRFRRAV